MEINGIKDKREFVDVQRKSFLSLYEIKRGLRDGVDNRPDMSAKDCAREAQKLNLKLEAMKS